MTQLGPQPPITVPWVDEHQSSGKPKSSFAQYMYALDQMLRSYFRDTSGLVNAANDGAAAAAGVKIGQFYRNGSAVQIRVV